uniref:Caspase 20, apoptosis-related cysteine peptidase n=1 Tax=Astatotilapia calliptera TaxID=8154 RepID=A0A3P8Q7M9_ASTCA
MAKTIKSALADTLENLSKGDFKRFCHQLLDRREEPRVKRNRVEGKSRLQITDVLVSTFTEEGALTVVLKILKAIGCNQLAKELEDATGGNFSKPDPGDNVLPQDGNMSKDVYQIISRPVGLCVIINNNNFKYGSQRRGTDKDAQSLAEVFSWLGFRVLMCKDLNKDQMDQALTFVASLADMSQLQKFNFKEWDGSSFVDPQQVLEHGDAFICSILSHGKKGVVLGTDRNPLPIKEITRKFRGCHQSVLTGKPKVFLIQACQGSNIQHGAQLMETDDDTSPSTIPEDADVLVAMATVEDHAAIRDPFDGSWFVQSLCEQLKERCPRGEDIVSILHYVNNDVAHRETSSLAKQMPEVRFTLRKKLVLQPQHS